MIDIGLRVSYFLFFVALGATIILPLIHAIKNPSGLLKSLLGVGGLVVLFVVAYTTSGDEVTAKAASLGVDAASSKMIGAGLMMFYIIFIVSVIGIVYSEINKALK